LNLSQQRKALCDGSGLRLLVRNSSSPAWNPTRP
jgi:hypothetical protein